MTANGSSWAGVVGGREYEGWLRELVDCPTVCVPPPHLVMPLTLTLTLSLTGRAGERPAAAAAADVGRESARATDLVRSLVRQQQPRQLLQVAGGSSRGQRQ